MPDFQRLAAGTPASDDRECVFCGRTAADGNDLVDSGDAAVCDECVAACADLLNEQPKEDAGASDAPTAPRTFVRVVGDADVERLVDMDGLIDAMEAALGSAPAVSGQAVPGAVLLFTPDRLALLALVSDRYLAPARTAALSALSAGLLARDDAGRLAILGAGTPARLQAEAMERTFELSSVHVWSPTSEDRSSLVEHIESLTKAPVESARTLEDAVRGADLIVLAMSSEDAIVQPEWIKEGAHLVIATSAPEDQHALEAALLRRGRVFGPAELGDIAAKRKDGRRSPREVTMFKPSASTELDVAAASVVYERALADRRGQEIEL